MRAPAERIEATRLAIDLNERREAEALGLSVAEYRAELAAGVEPAEEAKRAVDALGDLERPLSVEMLHEARTRELLSLADLPHRHGLGEDFDRAIGGGLNRGDIVAIGASGTGAGKTALGMQIVDGLALRSEDIVESGVGGVLTPTLIVSELSAEELMFRTIARSANVAHAVLQAGRTAERFISSDEVDRAFRAAEDLAGGRLAALSRWHLVMRPHEQRNAFMQQLKATLRALKLRTRWAYPDREVWPVVFIDPVQRWQDPEASEVEALNQLAEDLDAAADSEGWIVLLTSDTTKNAAKGEDESGVGAFRGSMKLLHAADVALVLDAGKPVTDPGAPRAASLRVIKTRRGPAGSEVHFAWYAGRGLRFEAQRRPVAAVDPATRLELLRQVVEREHGRGTEVTRRKLRAYTEDVRCPEKKLERLVDDGIAAGVIKAEWGTGRGGKRERLLPCPKPPPEPHWSAP